MIIGNVSILMECASDLSRCLNDGVVDIDAAFKLHRTMRTTMDAIASDIMAINRRQQNSELEIARHRVAAEKEATRKKVEEEAAAKVAAIVPTIPREKITKHAFSFDD